jgi:hypothetical protein
MHPGTLIGGMVGQAVGVMEGVWVIDAVGVIEGVRLGVGDGAPFAST